MNKTITLFNFLCFLFFLFSIYYTYFPEHINILTFSFVMYGITLIMVCKSIVFCLINKKHLLYFETQTNPLKSGFPMVALILLAVFIALQITFIPHIMSILIIFCFILIFLNTYTWFAIFPDGIVTNNAFYPWEKIKSIAWSDDDYTIVKPKKYNWYDYFFTSDSELRIHTKNLEQLNQFLTKYYGAPIKPQEIISNQESLT